MPLIKPYIRKKESRKDSQKEWYEIENEKREGYLIKHSPEYYEKKREKQRLQKLNQKIQKKIQENERKQNEWIQQREMIAEMWHLAETCSLYNDFYFSEKHRQFCEKNSARFHELALQLEQVWGLQLLFINFFSLNQIKLLFELFRQLRLKPEVGKELINIDFLNDAEGFRQSEIILSFLRETIKLKELAIARNS